MKEFSILQDILQVVHDYVEEQCPHVNGDKLHTHWSCRNRKCPFFITLASHLDQEVISVCFAYAIEQVGNEVQDD